MYFVLETLIIVPIIISFIFVFKRHSRPLKVINYIRRGIFLCRIAMILLNCHLVVFIIYNDIFLYYICIGSYYPLEVMFNISKMAFFELLRAITKPEITQRFQLHNLKELKENVTMCSHIVLRREIVLNSYEHHLLISEVFDNVVEIIHFGPRSLKLKSLAGKCTVHKRRHKWNLIFNSKAFESGIFLIRCNHYPDTDIEKKAAIDRAVSRLGESKYHLRWNNCEHYVTWALTGIPKCKQWRNAGILRRLTGDALDTVLCLYSSCRWFVCLCCRFIYDGAENRSSHRTGSTLIIAICISIMTKIVLDVSLISFFSENVYVPFFIVVMETVCLWHKLNDLKEPLIDGTMHPLDSFREIIIFITAPLASMLGSSVSANCLLPFVPWSGVAALLGFCLAKVMHSFLIGLSADLPAE